MLQIRVISAIRARMSERKLSQSGLAELLGASDAWVSRVLSGKIELSVNDLERICSALQTDTLNLMQQALLIAKDRPFHERDMQNRICRSELHFHLFFRLEEPQSFAQLASFAPNSTQEEIIEVLNNLITDGLVIKTDEGTYRTTDWRTNQYSLRPEDTYNDIISNIYSRQRGEPEKALKLSGDDLDRWKRHNTDAFYSGYFTESQIAAQVELARSFTAFVKTQTLYNMRINPTESKHLRAIVLSHLSFPVLN